MAATPAELQADVVVVGAGGAGLYTTLCAAHQGAHVALVSATPLAQTASYWAQGGLAAALGDDDSPQLHLADTERAGRGAMRHSAAEIFCAQAPDRVHELERLGVRFDLDGAGRLALGLEGGHSVRRVVHAGGSATGRRLVRQLSALVAEEPLVTVLEGVRASELLMREGRCAGVACEGGPERLLVGGGAVVICTGGAAALWSRTTNPPGSLGTGMLLAHAAGAELADLELVQFHPTAVIGVRGREGFLITEAIRGEGATLHDDEGARFVDELAPRDEVARAIWGRMVASEQGRVWLDMRAIDPLAFPNVFGALADAGVDATRERVPVAPAAHYVMGGVVVDLDGASSVPGLYVVGESACTGLHGANRLASNSLSECIVFGRRAAGRAVEESRRAGPPSALAPAARTAGAALPLVERSTREALSRHAGIERTRAGLEQLLSDPHPLAQMIARCALTRTESRGAHVRVDFPVTDPGWQQRHVVLDGRGDARVERWN